MNQFCRYNQCQWPAKRDLCSRSLTTTGDLLLRAVDKGLPLTFVKWLRDFLSNRQARLQINGKQGQSVPLKQGLPQGSALSPLLFLLYINDLKAVVPNGVEVSMFADDVSLFSSHPCKLTTQTAKRSRRMRRGVEQAAQDDAEHREL